MRMGKILIVDDHEGLRRMLARFLADKFTCAQAANGREALRKISGAAFDCVLSDINMPDMHGTELSRRIKERNPETRIVLMSASGETSRSLALASGADHYLPKPFMPKDLLGALGLPAESLA